MDNKDNELKNALDEIFGDDILEVDTNVSQKELLETHENEIKSNEEILDEPKIEIGEAKKEVVIEEEIIPEDTQIISSDEDKESSNIPVKKVVIIGVLVALFTIFMVFIIINYFGKKPKVINCSYLFDDTGYKISDEYKITFENKSISYIEGVYLYQSKNSDYDSQIEYIKQDKLPAIINSNGVKGFTYTYENSSSTLKISSYLDYSLMDFNSIKQINQDSVPLAYFKVDLEENNKNLIKNLEKQGYKCTKSK